MFALALFSFSCVNVSFIFFLLLTSSFSHPSLFLFLPIYFLPLSVTVSSLQLMLSLPPALRASLSLPACFSLLSPSICLFSACFSGLHSSLPPQPYDWPHHLPSTFSPYSPFIPAFLSFLCFNSFFYLSLHTWTAVCLSLPLFFVQTSQHICCFFLNSCCHHFFFLLLCKEHSNENAHLLYSWGSLSEWYHIDGWRVTSLWDAHAGGE